MSWLIRLFFICATAWLSTGCGGGGSVDAVARAELQAPQMAYHAAMQRWVPRPASPVTTFVYLDSDPGDSIGLGAKYLYTSSDTSITVTFAAGYLQVMVEGAEWWNGNFQMPSGVTTLREGTYSGLGAYLRHDPVKGGLVWMGEGRGCYTLIGSFSVANVVYRKERLESFDVIFDQHCEGEPAALRGLIHWDVHDKQKPSGHIPAIPAGLWAVPQGATPASGNYVYLESQEGDPVGGGRTLLYTQADAVLSVSREGNGVKVEVAGDEHWVGEFAGPSGLAKLKVGYYGWVKRYPFHNPSVGGMDWDGEGFGCNSVWGWFVIDEISYSNNDTISSLQMRFQQHCEGSSTNLRAPLHGHVRWNANDPTAPPGPVSPPPSDLWRPAAGATPSSGTYVYLENDRGVDASRWIERHTYKKTDSNLSISLSGARLAVDVRGDETWTGRFQGMSSINTLQVGYYGSLEPPPFNPAKGGMSVGCTELTGWFVIDELRMANGAIQFLKMRFQQFCVANTDTPPSLRGQIQWDASDTSAPSGPINPIPDSVWKPAAGATPAGGNYIYLKSEPGDFIGRGETTLITETISIDWGRSLQVYGGGWTGQFAPMNTLSQLQVGYYSDLQRYPFHNPAKGGMSWSGNGRGCSELEGWFAVDQITVVNGAVTSIKLRFEQRCTASGAPLHGEFRWSQ
jgi:hypothetical protein